MKKIYLAMFVAAALCSLPKAEAQVINTVVGSIQIPGYSGDQGAANLADIDNPSDIAIDSIGDLYIADFYNNVIRFVDTFGNIGTFAGTGFGAGSSDHGGYSGDGGPATAAELNGPYAVALDRAGNVYFADGYNHVVRKVDRSQNIWNFAGSHTTAGYSGDGGQATAATLDNPVALAIDSLGNVYIADDHNHVVRKVNPAGVISTVAGTDSAGYSGDGGPATNARLVLPIGVALDGLGNLYICDEDNCNIRKVTPAGIISTIVASGDTAHGYSGDGGPAAAARLSYPAHIAIGKTSNLYISDVFNNVIRVVDLESNVITTFAGMFYGDDDTLTNCIFSGDGGPATAAQLCSPNGIGVLNANYVYISDRGNEVIRLVSPYNSAGVKNVPSVSGDLIALPNPSDGMISVNLKSAAAADVVFTVCDILGHRVAEVHSTANSPVNIDIAAPDGVYFLSATTSYGTLNRQIVVRH